MLAAIALAGWVAARTGAPARTKGALPAAGPAAPLVVVDPGHGGIDPGSRVAGVAEAHVDLEVSLALAKALTRSGYRVLVTRSDGGCRPAVVRAARRAARAATCRINLRDRVLLAVHRHASVFLSVHADVYGDPSVRGPRTYYLEGAPLQQALAADIQTQLDAFRRRPLPPIPCRHFVLVALRDMPAVTIEVGYLSNPEERRLLLMPAHQAALADAVVAGVQRFASAHPLLPPPAIDVHSVERAWQARRGKLYRPYRHVGIGRVSM